jgi:hypothetical protein
MNSLIPLASIKKRLLIGIAVLLAIALLTLIAGMA